jgi:cytochrome c556
MRRLFGALATATYLTGLLLVTAAATKADRVAYEHRKEVMKQLGRNFYVGIGKVVSGELEYNSKDTVAAAEETVRVIPQLPTLFQPGSDLPESHLKTILFSNKARVDQTIADVNKQAEGLVPAVKTGDKPKIAAAYQALYDACNSCHQEFRKPYN